MDILKEDEKKVKVERQKQIRNKQQLTLLTGITQQESINVSAFKAFGVEKQGTGPIGFGGNASPPLNPSDEQSNFDQKRTLQRYKTVNDVSGSRKKLTGITLVRQGSEKNLGKSQLFGGENSKPPTKGPTARGKSEAPTYKSGFTKKEYFIIRKKISETGAILELKMNILNQVAPMSDKKVQNFWRRIDQFYVLQKDFKEFLGNIIEDQLLIGKFLVKLISIENPVHKDETLNSGKFYIEYIRHRIEKIREKCWKHMQAFEKKRLGL
jgi:hypothetical protein